MGEGRRSGAAGVPEPVGDGIAAVQPEGAAGEAGAGRGLGHNPEELFALGYSARYL